MKKFNTIWLVIFMVTLLLSGCTSTNDHEVASIEEDETLKEVFIGEGVDFVHSFSSGEADEMSGFFYYVGNVYETLVVYDEDGVKPCLAESWEINNNEITFKLRKGVLFTDGTELKADVVKLNFDMTKKLLSEKMTWFGAISKLDQVEVVDDYTVKIKYKSPYYAALQDLTAVYPMGIMSANAFKDGKWSEELKEQTFGSGPYMLEKYESGKYYSFKRNDTYWGEKPEVEKFTVKIIPDMESRMFALRAKEIDFISGTWNISQDAFLEAKNEEQLGTKKAEVRRKTRNILLNSSRAPFDDKKVRLAAQYAINKDVICENVLGAIDEKADTLLNPKLPYCDVKVEPYVYNKEKAEELLEKSGWRKVDGSTVREKDGKKLKIELLFKAGCGTGDELSQVIAGQLKEVGFDVTVTGLEMMAWYGKALEGKYDVTVNVTYGIPYDPHTFMSPMLDYGIDKPAQEGIEEKPEIDRRIREIFATVDSKVIQDHYTYILTTLHEQGLNIPISHSKEIAIFNKEKIKDYIFDTQTHHVNVKGIVGD